jgi:pilus assembly protein CpaC
LVALAVGAVFFAREGWAQTPSKVSIEATSPQKVSLTVGKSMVIRSASPIKRVSLGAPEIADAVVLTPSQVSLTGKAPGVTNLTLWEGDTLVSAVLDVEVSPDIIRLTEMLQKILPDEDQVRVTATHDSITLSGTVSSPSNLSQVLAMAEPFFPKKVVNLLKVEALPDASGVREMFQKALPEEKGIQVVAGREGITIVGTVSSDATRSQALALAESQFPKRVVSALKVETTPTRFKEMLHKILPEEKEIRVITTHDGIVLSGTVSSTANLSQVLAVAESQYPKKVVNLLQVGGVHQVMLEVRVAEMSRTLLRRLGINFNYISESGKNLGLTLLNNLTSLPEAGIPVPGIQVASKIDAIFRFMSHGTTWTFFIDALKEDGLLSVLAEPTLITLSGKTANFLAGGEFPVPVPQSGVTNTITVEYKPFGVGLNFTPTVLSPNKISMQVAPEVSELDFSKSITISGFQIPSLTTRRVSTVVELADGQSFAIAGLLKHDIREVVTRFPVLGDLPVLGTLFRSSSFQKNETELIVIVTPHLVKPLDLAKQTLPTDAYVEPDDLEFYLLGRLEGREKPKAAQPPGASSGSRKEWALEGKFGHILQK